MSIKYQDLNKNLILDTCYSILKSQQNEYRKYEFNAKSLASKKQKFSW